MNTEPIDIVIPWLNPTEKWFSQYKQYCENENPARIRDLNTIRPCIKSIIKNLPWIRYIWLIVFDEEQIPPDWEELKNEKIKIVYHKDIIPNEFLPTFNSIHIAVYTHNIKDLSENFIWSNDDIIFKNFIPQEFFFNNDKSVHRKNNIKEWKNLHCNTYAEILNSTADFVYSICDKRILADDNHIAIPIKKSLIHFIYVKYKNEIEKHYKNSKIRKFQNINTIATAFTLEEIYNKCEYGLAKNIKYGVLHLSDFTSKQKIEQTISNNDIICINDSEELVKTWKEKANWLKELFTIALDDSNVN